MVYTDEERESRTDVFSSYQSHINQFVAAAATGSKDVKNDAVWNEYLKGLEEYGQSTLLKLTQDAFDRLWK